MHRSEPPLLPLPTANITTNNNNNNNHYSCRPWGIFRSPSPLPSPPSSPPLSLSNHPPSPSPSPLPLRRFCFFRRICNPWPPPLPPPSFSFAVSVAVTPPPLLLRHMQPRYEIMHGSPVNDGGRPHCRRPRRRRSPSPSSPPSLSPTWRNGWSIGVVC